MKAKVGSLAPQAHISVIPVRGEEEFGSFVSNDQESFTFYDVDQKTNISLRYDDVRKVKNGYGGYNRIRGRHTDRTRVMVVRLVLAGGLVALIFAVALAS